jgi:putative ABC transport system permease protein
MRSIIQDLSFAIRTLRKSPGYAIAALLVLALGIGANTSIFTVVNAVLLRPLPFGSPERLVRIWHTPPQSSFPGMKIFAVSAANYLDWERQNQVFEKMAISTGKDMNLTGAGEAESMPAESVSRDYFTVLQAKPYLGRTFLPEEDQVGKNQSVILSYAVWKSRFGGNSKIVGQQITLNRESYNVVGVMGPDFRFPAFAKLWTPMGMTPQEAVVRGEHHYRVVARLKPGVDARQAQAALDTISLQLAQQYPADDKGWGAAVIPLREAIVGDVRPALLVLLGAVGFVLLIACANVANLTLVRTLARRKEIAIRTALGAGRRRVIQQVLAESVLLSLGGGVVGILLSHFGTQLIVKALSDKLPRFHEIHLDAPVLAFTFALAGITGVLAGLLPAWRATQSNPNIALKQGLGRTDSDSGPERTRNVLVSAEVALSLVLLFGAGLMMRTLGALRAVNPGFESSNVLALHVGIPATKFANPAEQGQFYDRVLQRLRQLPGVQSAGAIDSLPMEGGSMQPIAIEGRPVVAMADQPEVAVRMITPQYRDTMRIPLVRGRDIADSDSDHAPRVVVISQAMAKRFWPGEDPIGRHLTLTFFPGQVREIVGILGDVKQNSLDDTGDDATLYFPAAQIEMPKGEDWRSFGLSLAVRAASHPEALGAAATNAIHEIDREVPVVDVMTMDAMLGDSIAQQRFTMLLLQAFAGLALILAAVGIYSVLAYSVRRRMREIGIRMALGALPVQLLRMIVMEGLRPTIIGLVVGIAASLAIGRLLTSVIFGVKPTDVLTFSAVSALLLAVSVLASVLPGYRAMRVEPMKTLRED